MRQASLLMHEKAPAVSTSGGRSCCVRDDATIQHGGDSSHAAVGCDVLLPKHGDEQCSSKADSKPWNARRTRVLNQSEMLRGARPSPKGAALLESTSRDFLGGKVMSPDLNETLVPVMDMHRQTRWCSPFLSATATHHSAPSHFLIKSNFHYDILSLLPPGVRPITRHVLVQSRSDLTSGSVHSLLYDGQIQVDTIHQATAGCYRDKTFTVPVNISVFCSSMLMCWNHFQWDLACVNTLKKNNYFTRYILLNRFGYMQLSWVMCPRKTFWAAAE